ncbi:MAG: hypothetical protein DYG89_22510 [Caldilinea sp. CFX5]|nr:hypothetical protein [Caldilinea sp. CFX5]
MTPQRLLQDLIVACLLVVINFSRFVQCTTNLNHKILNHKIMVWYTAETEQEASSQHSPVYLFHEERIALYDNATEWYWRLGKWDERLL